MAVTVRQTEQPVRWLDAGQERAFFDRQARALLGISGSEFVRRWQAGAYDDIADDPKYTDMMYLAMLSRVGR